MNKKELIEKLEDIEWEDFEVKEAKSEIPKSSWETVSAFSNTVGGWLVFGVKNPEKTELDFNTTLRNGTKFNRKIEVICKRYNFDGGTVLAFYILTAKKKPVFYTNPKFTGWKSYYKNAPKISRGFDYYRIEFFLDSEKTTQKIIALTDPNPKITRKELAELTEITENGIKYHLKKMQEEGIIKRVGPDKGGY